MSPSTTIIPRWKLRELGITFSPSTLYRRERDGTFPARVKLGPRHHGYRLDQIQKWLADRIAEHDAEVAARSSMKHPVGPTART